MSETERNTFEASSDSILSSEFVGEETDINGCGATMIRSKSSPSFSNLEESERDYFRHKRNESFSNLRENFQALANVAEQHFQNFPKPPEKVVSMWKAFRDFAFQGSMIDLAVGIIVGGAFGKIVNSLVNDIIMPPIGWLLSGVDFANIYVLLKRGKKNKLTNGRYKSLNQAKEDGAVTVNIGVFLNTVLNFVVVSLIIFVFVRTLDKLKRKKSPTMKKCKYCYSKVDHRASKCAFCCSEIEVVDSGSNVCASSSTMTPSNSTNQAAMWDTTDMVDTSKDERKINKGSVKVLKKNLKKQFFSIEGLPL